MTSDRRRFFLVERYMPSITSESVAVAAKRLAELDDESARHLYTVLVAEEETCLSVFEASDTKAVEAANAAARFQVDRIVEIEIFPGLGRPRHSGPSAAEPASSSADESADDAAERSNEP